MIIYVLLPTYLFYTRLCIYLEECVTRSDGLVTFLKYLCRDILSQARAHSTWAVIALLWSSVHFGSHLTTTMHIAIAWV